MGDSLLTPAAILVLWTMIVLFWMVARRAPALPKAIGAAKRKKDNRLYRDIEEFMPDKANWASHNYTHLMEQPTVFYPAVVILHLAGANSNLNLGLAWAYVVIRIVHSLWQLNVNKIPVRIALFVLSSLCLAALAISAVIATI
jgi:hypothetical protein